MKAVAQSYFKTFTVDKKKIEQLRLVWRRNSGNIRGRVEICGHSHITYGVEDLVEQPALNTSVVDEVRQREQFTPQRCENKNEPASCTGTTEKLEPVRSSKRIQHSLDLSKALNDGYHSAMSCHENSIELLLLFITNSVMVVNLKNLALRPQLVEVCKST